MTTYFVTRHDGAIEWAKRQCIEAEFVEHLDPEAVKIGDVIVGTLPVNVVATINERSARYLHLTLDTPLEHRGRELSAEDMEAFGAKLEEYEVRRVAL